MRCLISGLLLVLIFYFVWLTWFGERGNRALKSFELEIERLQENNQELVVENQRFSRRIRLLQSDARYQELVVRRELHMIRDSEIIFLFDEDQL
ncbi:septum formation initiator family protein [bacterium]|nr:septum formation initiator family protein [bacterium]